MNASRIRYVPKNDLVRHTITAFLWYHNHIIIFLFAWSRCSKQRMEKREDKVVRNEGVRLECQCEMLSCDTYADTSSSPHHFASFRVLWESPESRSRGVTCDRVGVCLVIHTQETSHTPRID